MIFIDCSIDRLGSASTQAPESVPKHQTLDFYWQADLGLHLSGMFSSRYTVFYKAGCCRSCSLNPLNLPFNLDLKAAVKNVHKPQQVLHNSGKVNAVIILKQMPFFFSAHIFALPALPDNLTQDVDSNPTTGYHCHFMELSYFGCPNCQSFYEVIQLIELWGRRTVAWQFWRR